MNDRMRIVLAVSLFVSSIAFNPLGGTITVADDGATPREQSLADRRIDWPTPQQWTRVLLLRDYNTRIVLAGTSLLGVCGGVVGVFMLLRRRALIGDVVSHAALPGVAVAFLCKEAFWPGGERALGILLAGALVAGLLAVVCTTAISRWTRIKDDAALAIVLSIFFGIGVALFTVIQDIPSGKVAGLNHFIYGKTASMIASDVWLISGATSLVLVASLLLFKEFTLMCFDERYGLAQGWPVRRLDLVLLALVVGVTVVGLQSVGLLLVVALLIIPAAAARFWSDRIGRLAWIAGLIGGLSAAVGVLVSALFPRLAAGAVIVLSGAFFFVVSLLFGARRGVLHRLLLHHRLRRSIDRHHVLRALYEIIEARLSHESKLEEVNLSTQPVQFAELQPKRSWSTNQLRKLLAKASSEGLIRPHSSGGYSLTSNGVIQARRVVKNHRLWELYLIQYADVAPSHVDHEADRIEHILDPAVLDQLEHLLGQRHPHLLVPESPHEIKTASRM